MDATRPWFESAFDRGYLDVYPHRDARAARREIAGLMQRGLAPREHARVLDLGCGFGRHSLALAEHGLDVVGLDLSADLLEHAARLEGAEVLAGRLVRGDFRRLPFQDGSFDSVLMLFSSFGYFDDRVNGAVLAELARVARPDGVVLLDLMNAERIRATLVPESRAEKDGRTLHETRLLTDAGRRVRKDVVLTERDGTTRAWHEDVRLYDAPELVPLLARAGLELERMEGDFDGSAADAEAARRIVWARKT